MHRQNRLWIPWRKRRPSVEDVLAAARRRDEAEHRAAISRILAQPTQRLPVITRRPARPSQVAPLLTPGQAARARRTR